MPAVTESTTEIQANAMLHSLLAKAFNYPDKQLASSILSGELPRTLSKCLKDTGHERAAKEVISLAPARKTAQPKLLLELEKDYTWLFFASKPRCAYLFESVYQEGKLLQESTFDIAGLYRDAGLVLNEDFRLPPDHIAVELEFLSFLYFKELDGLQQQKPAIVEYARELQAKVAEEHLGHFAHDLGTRVAQHAKTPFYRTMANILRGLYSQ
jgi:TorA maturation chaperone TorD